MSTLLEVIRSSFIVHRKKQNVRATNDKRQTTNQPGFTLIELMIAIIIVSILSAVGLVAYSSSQKNASISKRLQDLQALQTAIETYKSANGKYPIVTTNPAICIDATGGLGLVTSPVTFVPTYIQTIPVDPSAGANCYKYRSDANGVEYKLFTYNTDMTSTEYYVQPNYVDPSRDGTGTPPTTDCKIDKPDPLTVANGSNYAWAVYASKGSTASDACAF